MPDIALSVRQPWAWAIVAGHKVIENRSLASIRAGGMTCRRVAIHAALGMTAKEYAWAFWRLERHGVRCPAPAQLSRRGIVGAVDVTDIVSESDSQWFGGDHGLVLANAVGVDPIPAPGALGYFDWTPGGALAEPTPWMRSWEPGGLFPDLAPSFREPPEKPFGSSKRAPPR
ncbi:MAG: hypothetical protein AAFR35_01055 [Pseudomonadota bacterium]